MFDMDFAKDYVFEDDVAHLRPLCAADVELLAPFALNEPEIWKYSLQPGDGLANLKTYLASALDGRVAGTEYPFLVTDKRTGETAGSTRFYDFQRTHATTQLGFTWYGKRFQRTGLNQHCKHLMLEFAFEHLELERVEFRADARNERSIAAMKGIGCQVEGILRSNCASPDGRRDSIVLSILKNEWHESVKASLAARVDSR